MFLIQVRLLLANAYSYIGLICDLLWSDPDPDTKGWEENERGVSYVFGDDIVKLFNDKN